MKKFLAIVPLYISALFFLGCNVKNNLISNLWFYTHSSNTQNSHDSLLTPVSFIYLQPDGNYTRDFGVFEYGKWQFNNSQLLLTSSKSKTIELDVKNIGINEMQLQGTGGVISNFEKQPASFTSSLDNPFSKENNTWRILAVHKETDMEIKNRLQNHCKFWETYFAWALKNEMQYIDVRSTPTLIKIYGNGFGLKPYQDLPSVWRSYFFDAEDCEKANAILKTVFDKGNISWAHTDNKYKMFISAFQQLEQQLQ